MTCELNRPGPTRILVLLLLVGDYIVNGCRGASTNYGFPCKETVCLKFIVETMNLCEIVPKIYLQECPMSHMPCNEVEFSFQTV